MSKFTSAIYHEDIKTAEYFVNGASSLLRTKGSVAWRFNNPGCVVYSKFIASLPGYIGYAIVHNSPDPDVPPYKFAIFDTYENGREACRQNLKRNYANKNISDMTSKYAGKYDKSNDPEAYAAFIMSQTGIGKDTTVSEMNDQALDAILDAIEKKEAYIPGKETKVSTTSISLTDGIQPVAGYPLKVKLGTCEYDWKTNDYGELPTIAHMSDGMAIEAKAENSKGELETLYSAKAGTESKNILLKRKFVQYKANTLAQNPKVPREKSQPKPVDYIVQSGDVLSKIATRFGVSVSELVASNGIKDANKIYPGQKIVIFGKKESSSETSQDTPVDLSGQYPPVQLGDTYPLPPYPDSIETKDIPKAAGSDQSKSASSQPSSRQHSEPTAPSVPSHSTGAQGKASTPSSTSSTPVTPSVNPKESKEKLETVGGKNSGNGQAHLPVLQGEAPWMEIAIREAMEWKGQRSGKIKDNYHSMIDVEGSPTMSTAWCASFVNYCLKEARYPYLKSADSQFPTYKKNRNIFREIPSPVYGAIMVFRRYYHEGGNWTQKGHVSFVYAKDKNGDIAALGGNQGDSIKLSSYSETEPFTYKSKDLGCYVDVKFYKYYVPAQYYDFAMRKLSEALTIIDVEEVNSDFFGKAVQKHKYESVG